MQSQDPAPSVRAAGTASGQGLGLRSGLRLTSGLGLATRSPAPWLVALRWAAAAVTVAVLAWLSFTRNGWVPFLSGVDLGVHEFGHLIFVWAPDLWVALAGSLVQAAAPAGLAAYFLWRGDRLAVVLMVGWLGMSLHNVSVYIRDATRMELPLFGDDGSGAGHDWRNILGGLGWLDHTVGIAGMVTAWSVVAFITALGLAGWFARQDLATARVPRDDSTDADFLGPR